MASIKGRDTSPERMVRSYLHAAGFRFRLNVRALPGTPDIVLPRHKLAIFVHGCFWHRHPGCKFAATPATRIEFWATKFKSNIERDIRAARELQALGWTVETVWECELKDPTRLDNLFWKIQTLG